MVEIMAIYDAVIMFILKTIKQFVDLLNLSSGHQRKVPPETALKYLNARNQDVNRAVQLYQNDIETRQREKLYGINFKSDPLLSELRTGKFTILPSRDFNGSAIALFTACLHNPQIVSHRTTLQGIVYQLDCALLSPETQSNGLVFIYDMSNSKYSNFDYELSQKILTMLKGSYPAKLKKVLIVTAPLWFKAPFKILRLFVREKLRDRVFTVSVSNLSLHIPKTSLPTHLGGTLVNNHLSWLEYCSNSMTNREEDETLLTVNTVGQESPTQTSKIVSSEKSDDSGLNGNDHNALESTNDAANIKTSDTNGVITTDIQWSIEKNPSSASPSSGFSDDDSLQTGVNESEGKTILQVVEMVKQLGKKGLMREYGEIRAKQPDGNFENARMRHNITRNRYTDVLCLDHSRVILSESFQDENSEDQPSDYINANFVDGYKQKNAYISTQGPLPKTAADFWQMLWDQKSLVIVMTTKTTERGRVKCFQYWDSKPDESSVYGNFETKTTAVETNEDYTVTSIEIKNIKTEEVRKVSHWQFTSWPDYGVPSSASAMLTFLKRVRDQQAAMLTELGDSWTGHSRGPPIIVHCSAGIGRTGTFITLDVCISRLEDIGTVDIKGTVEKIRAQRAYSIQMPDQYVFCHMALIEYAILNKHLNPDEINLDGFEDENSDSD